MWEKFHVIWICIERDPSIWSFSLSFEVSFFWKRYLFVVIINKAEILREGTRHSCSCFTKILERSEVICEQCSFAKLLWQKFVLKKHQSKSFEVEQIQLGRSWRKEFEDWEAQIHYQDLRTKVWELLPWTTQNQTSISLKSSLLFSTFNKKMPCLETRWLAYRISHHLLPQYLLLLQWSP